MTSKDKLIEKIYFILLSKEKLRTLWYETISFKVILEPPYNRNVNKNRKLVYISEFHMNLIRGK